MTCVSQGRRGKVAVPHRVRIGAVVSIVVIDEAKQTGKPKLPSSDFNHYFRDLATFTPPDNALTFTAIVSTELDVQLQRFFGCRVDRATWIKIQRLAVPQFEGHNTQALRKDFQYCYLQVRYSLCMTRSQFTRGNPSMKRREAHRQLLISSDCQTSSDLREAVMASDLTDLGKKPELDNRPVLGCS